MRTEFITADGGQISSLRCGGTIFRLFAPSNVRELSEYCSRNRGERYKILGGLTNTLVLSGGVKEIAVISDNMRGLTVEGHTIKAFAGEKLTKVATVARTYGLTGMENFVGIPGTVGGAVKGNAGCFGGEISDILRGVEIVNLDTGETEFVPSEEIAFGYRYCNLRNDRDFIYRAWFDLYPGRYDRIENEMKRIRSLRAESQPKRPSLGSVSKKYGAVSAGWYIEQSGLKGYRYGGMEISDVHANFIVNVADGKPEEYLYLVELAEKKVYENFGIKLAREVKVIGEQEGI